MKSMTGFARCSLEAGEYTLSGTLTSVNGKHLNLKVRLPEGFEAYEPSVRKLLHSRISRGSATFQLSFESYGGSSVRINKDAVTALRKEWEAQLGQTLDAFTPQDLAAVPGLLQEVGPEIDDNTKASVLELTSKLADEFDESRLREGGDLKQVLARLINTLSECLATIEKFSAVAVQENFERVKQRVNDLLQANEIEVSDEDLIKETAIYSDRIDITEEIDRLTYHIGNFTETMEVGRGKKLDFILQEMHREINTIGSKSSHIEIGRAVIEAKTTVESIREQTANIE